MTTKKPIGIGKTEATDQLAVSKKPPAAVRMETQTPFGRLASSERWGLFAVKTTLRMWFCNFKDSSILQH